MSINNNRPKVRVFNGEGKVVGSVKLPAVFKAPIRNDIVQFVQTNVAKNARQPYAVSMQAGHQTSAESWGTGRAVARIPRVPGGGTHRAGQGAFGNMCRGGRMFAPTRTWRRWHRKVHANQRRFAITSSLAASSIAPLVQARGHKIDKIPEIPLVVAGEAIETIETSKKALAFLTAIGAAADVLRVKESKTLRPGKGKLRNRRYRKRRGPLIVHNLGNNNVPLVRSFRNIPGVEFSNVQSLNPLLLAPGGHVGRFIIWTKSAFELLDSVYGTGKTASKIIADYRLPRQIVSSDDISRVIHSDQIQSILRPYKGKNHNKVERKYNPFKHPELMARLNPAAPEIKAAAVARLKDLIAKKATKRAAKKAGTYKAPVGGLTSLRTKTKAKTAAFRKNVFG